MRHLLLLAALPLAACSNRGDGTSISITSENGSAGMANGTASIDVPGFKGSMTLPKFTIKADNVDLDGAKLYPGSTITDMNIAASDGKVGEKDHGTVRMRFASPAAPAAVRDHLRKQLTDAHFKVADDGDGLSGTNDDGEPFKLTLTPAGTDRTAGELTMGR